MLSQFKRPRRVVITGMGCVTPIGIGRQAFWAALTKGESGVRRIESFDVSNSPVKIAAEVREFDWEAQLNPKDRKHVPRTVPLALAAATAKSACPKCGAANLTNAKFCNECGTKMETAGQTVPCAKCGAQLPVGTRFCNECGTKVEPGS